MSIRFDMGDVRRLERHLARVVPRARRDARAVTMRGAMNIKRDWKSNARSSAPKHAPAYPSSIGFDLAAYGPDIWMAIIGPDKGGPQGALGNLLEYGSAHNPPHRDGGRALDVEEPRFEAQMALIAERGLAWW
ncbi:hypothetical protein ACIP8U_00360 [Streptomyces pseudovenezuelae]|uniref:hypothetical protein n=1 Tax=Streptomyces pseudovenezuelae TaxID=67350 RepID=UPI0038047870